jgi:O-antigen/teichoic acid export membrane protein
LLKIWLGASYATEAAPILAMLVGATMVRNALLPYVTLSIGIGYQRKLTWIPLTEGSVSIIASIFLVGSFGAYGVAIAKLVGGFTGIILLILNHPLKVPLGDWSRLRFLYDCVFCPAIAIIPVFVLSVFLHSVFPEADIARFVIISIASCLSIYFLTLSREDRVYLVSYISSRVFSKVPRRF